MKVLLDTNIIIHREASKVINPDIGILFQWLDKLHCTKCVHPLTIDELNKNINKETVNTFNIKLGNYNTLKTEAPLHDYIDRLCTELDITENDSIDTRLLNEVYCGRVDILISEDRKIHAKANLAGIGNRVYKIDSFLEWVTSENPELVDYKVLAVKKEFFGKIDLNDPFFQSFKEDYVGFEKWFNKKSDEIAYICYDNKAISSFLFVKKEDENENYQDISPSFNGKKRLKIGTFKVINNGFKLGERFLKIVFDNARLYKVDEIYVTIFDKRPEQIRLIELLETWGFVYHGVKTSSSGEEKVYIRDLTKEATNTEPKSTYPKLSKTSEVYFVSIHPKFHTELFPDSILKTESPNDFVENEPHRNALSKVYISHSSFRELKSGDIVVFYRTGGLYAGVATTIGIIEGVKTNIKDADELIQVCRKRTVFKDDELKNAWDRFGSYKPFVVDFLYAYSFRKRPTLKQLNELGVIKDITKMPRGFSRIDRDVFIKLIQFAGI